MSRNNLERIGLRSFGSLQFTTTQRTESFRECSSSFRLRSRSGITLVSIMFSSPTRFSIGWFFVMGIYTEDSLCEYPVLTFLSRSVRHTTNTSEYQSMSPIHRNSTAKANKALVPTAGAALPAMLSVILTRPPVSTLTPAPAVGTA